MSFNCIPWSSSPYRLIHSFVSQFIKLSVGLFNGVCYPKLCIFGFVCSCSVVAIFHGPQPPYLIGSLHSLFSLHWSLNLPYLPSDNDCCSRNVCGASRPFDIKILDNNQREVMHLSRPLRCSTCWCPCFLQVTYIDTWSMAPTPYCVFHTNTAGGQPCPLYGVLVMSSWRW